MNKNFTTFDNFFNSDELKRIEENLVVEITEEQERSLQIFESMYNDGKITDKEILDWLENPTNEGVLGSLLGGITGFALGKKIGKIMAKVLGIEKGILYDLLTSRIFGAALGSSIGKQF